MMKCYSCGFDAVEEEAKMLNLDGVAFVEGTIRVCANCDSVDEIYPQAEGLFGEVAKELANADRRLTPRELQWLRKSTGASGKDWSKFIGMRHETLSRWENGKEPYPLAEERLLRLAIVQDPMDWQYQDHSLQKTESPKPIELRTNSVGHWFRV